jgi:hypothetical protein
MRSLLEKVVAHMRGNHIQIPPNLEALAEHYTCQGQGPNVCEENDARQGWLSGAMLKFKTVLAGTKILGEWLASGKPTVPQEQADARSAVCAGCVFNQDPKDCATCAWPALTELVTKILGGRRSKHHDKLKSCASCGCAISVKCWVPIGFLKQSFGYENDLPEWCWVLKEMEETNG